MSGITDAVGYHNSFKMARKIKTSIPYIASRKFGSAVTLNKNDRNNDQKKFRDNQSDFLPMHIRLMDYCFHFFAAIPLRSQTIFPARIVSSASSLRFPSSLLPAASTKPYFPFDTLNTAISATEPSLRFPRSSRFIDVAAFHVARLI